MELFEHIEPQKIWYYFNEISKIPRPSGKEQNIISYIVELAKEYRLKHKIDKVGNILVKKAATQGYEKRQTVVLQSHLDMVCEKNSNTEHDFEKDPLKLYEKDGWITAEGTTLGADNGIGVAAMLAILFDVNEIEHGPVECLFTIEEETGLTGAKQLNPNFIKGKYLLNLDADNESELFIGCAGGIDTVAYFDYHRGRLPRNTAAYLLTVSGLQGGHSGEDINKNRGNAIKIMNRFLWTLSQKFIYRLSIFEGGNLRNAIPREAYAIIVVNKKRQAKLLDTYFEYKKELSDEYGHSEPELRFAIDDTNIPQYLINRRTQRQLLDALQTCPSGVINNSYQMKEVVETSTNLSSIKFQKNNRIEVVTNQRSLINSAKKNTANSVKCIFKMANATVKQSGDYPGWSPNKKSEILTITENAYSDIFQKKPNVRAIHAGLECGLFLTKYPDLDMISFGPTIKNAHSPSEKVNIESVEKFWKLLTNVLLLIPEK